MFCVGNTLSGQGARWVLRICAEGGRGSDLSVVGRGAAGRDGVGQAWATTEPDIQPAGPIVAVRAALWKSHRVRAGRQGRSQDPFGKSADTLRQRVD